jgi:chromosome segregation ATPase
MEKESVMNKKELIPQLTALVEGYTEGLISANNKLFHSGQRLTAEKHEWEQKYHSAMAANKKLEERNEGLQVEKLALLDVVSEVKSEVQSLTVLNKTISEEPNMLRRDNQVLLKTVQIWQRNYRSIKHELDQVRKELAEADAERLRLHCLLQSRTEELAAAEKKHEDFKTKSHGILATMGENLQKKQEIIEALTCWKEFAENTIHELSEKLKDAKDVIQTQENTIEWLDGKVKRLKEKKAKKEQND